MMSGECTIYSNGKCIITRNNKVISSTKLNKTDMKKIEDLIKTIDWDKIEKMQGLSDGNTIKLYRKGKEKVYNTFPAENNSKYEELTDFLFQLVI